MCGRGEGFMGVPTVEQPGEAGNRHEATTGAFTVVDEGSIVMGEGKTRVVGADLDGGLMVLRGLDVKVRVAWLSVTCHKAVEKVGGKGEARTARHERTLGQKFLCH